MLEVLWAQQFTSLITHQHVQRAEDNLHKFRCETRSCAGSHIIKIEPICYELGNVSGKSSKERAKFSWSSKTEKFFMYVNSIDSKKKNNLLAIVWFDHPGRKIFLESVHRQRVRVFEFLNPFEYTLPILISNFNILFYYELECVGEFPNKYVRFSFEFGEYYDHVSFPELDLDKFEHLYYMRDRDRRNPRRRK